MSKRLLAGLIFGAALVTAQPAAAFDPLTITYLSCEPLGGGRGLCYAEVTGGAGGNTYTWTQRQAGTTITSTWTTTSGSTIRGCSVGKSYYVTLTVTDSVGATTTGNSSYYCTQIAP